MRFNGKSLIRSARRSLRVLAAIAIGCQFLVPMGYMPGSLANGTPVVLCSMYTTVPAHGTTDTPERAPASGMDSMHAGMPDTGAHSPDTGEHTDHIGAEAWEHCPLGALGASAALAFTIEPVIEPAGPDRISTHLAVLLRSVSNLTARARAPPVSAIQRSA